MRVSVRLQQNLWALALVMSFIVTPSPLNAQGQFQYSVGEQPSETENGEISSRPNAQQPAEPDRTSLVEAKRALFKARQALAHSDVETAQSMVESAIRQAVDFKLIGDSPTTVQSMIDRQIGLSEMAENRDPAYNASAAAFLLTQSEALVYYQDFETAEMLISQARKFPVEFDANIGNPDELQKLIEIARENAAVAESAPAKTPPAKLSKLAETMKLLSEAQLAIDQEKWNEAKLFIDEAKQLGVEDKEFAANAPRPWQLELKIQNALNRQSFDPAVIQTNFEDPGTSRVVQADYDPSTDTTKNVQVTGTEFDSTDFHRIPNDAYAFYRSGLQALDNKDPAQARDYFERAWQNRDQIDGATRQSIQDQLTRLTMSSSAAPTVAQASQEIDLSDARSQQNSMFKELQSEIFKKRAEAERMLESKPREALEIMTMIRGRIAQSQLDAKSQRPLLTIIDRDLNEMQRYIDQNLPEIINDETNADRKEQVELRRQRRVDVGTQLQGLVEEFNNLIDEQRFPEALVVARQATDLDPENPAVVLLMEKAKLITRLTRITRIREQKEETFLASMYNAEEAGIAIDDNFPVQIGDAEQWIRNRNRRNSVIEAGRYDSESDLRIWNTLKNERVQGEYKGTLAEAIDQLSRQAGVNIVFDDLALAAENVQKDRLVDVPIREPISLRSALEVILQSAGLVFVVENEVIKVTSRDASHSKLQTKTYYIGDLVMPIKTPENPMQMNFMQPNMGSPNGNGVMNVSHSSGSSVSQLAMAQQLGPNGPLGGLNGMTYGGNNGPQTGVPTFGTVGGQPLGGITEQDFQPLIELIQNTINPDAWQDTGQGLGTIEAFVPNLSLIVSQTQEIQDEIQDLLKKLRELNDVQIVVEVRFVTLNDTFFERVGIDFDFSIEDKNPSGVDATADVVPGGSTIVGRGPVDGTGLTTTSDLDLQFVQNSFAAAEPVFGGFQASQAANFGFAILSDIEVFFLIQAAKGDTRSNITEAPTVTMFNGQSASVTNGAQRPFVTSVIPVVGDFAVAHQPVITILPDGTNLNVTAVVSADRRFVRLQLNPFFTEVQEVETFTFDGSTTTEQTTGSVLDNLLDAVDGSADDNPEELQTTTQGITIQLPVLAITSVNTVVSVPDGGTVLMGGIKRMNEGRTERGVPFLSNVPYVNRLFKNVGIGHQTSNLMMMVTPRIIIQKEIEEDQVGLTNTN